MTHGTNMRKFILKAILIGTISAWLLSAPFPALALHGRDISTGKIYSQVLREQRIFSVSLPVGYQTERKTYPVLYILDAEGEILFRRCVLTVKELGEKNLVPPMIIVGIWNADRNRDMIPVEVPHRPGSGGAENFLAFINQELKSHIQKEYRASDMAILYVMSNSALFDVYALLEFPEVFDGVIASSP